MAPFLRPGHLPRSAPLVWTRLLGTETGSVLMVLAFLPLAWWAVSVLARRRLHRITAWADVVLVYTTVAGLALTLTPGGENGLSLVPFRDLSTMPGYQVVGNILLWATPAVILPLRFPEHFRWWRVVVLAGVWSTSVETAQYVLQIGRVASIDDAFLNTIGASVAAAVAVAWRTLFVTRPGGEPATRGRGRLDTSVRS